MSLKELKRQAEEDRAQHFEPAKLPMEGPDVECERVRSEDEMHSEASACDEGRSGHDAVPKEVGRNGAKGNERQSAPAAVEAFDDVAATEMLKWLMLGLNIEETRCVMATC